MKLEPRDSLSIDRKARVYMPYLGPNYRSVRERVYDFKEVILPFDEERAKFEASRCIQCPDPAPCVEACPLHNNIPGALWHIEHEQYLEAAVVFRMTSSLPEVCGRVCPQEKLCEGSCVHSVRGEAIPIGLLETFVTDYEHLHGEVGIHTEKPTGHRIAVIGGGPSGLACAERLIGIGHSVTIFDSKPLPGGLLLYGIPGFKLNHEILFSKICRLADAGVNFASNRLLGRDTTVDDLFNEGFEAIYIAVGTGVDNDFDIPGEDLPQVYKGTEFLIRANVDIDKLPLNVAPTRPEVGSKVAIIGGGDTSSDCLRTAVRLGAEEVICVYRRSEDEMPGGTKDRKLARDEGAKYIYQSQPVRFIAGEDGKLVAIECVKMALGELDDSGRPRPVPIEGSNFTIEVDTAVLALGYTPYPTIGESTPGLATKENGLITVNQETMATSREGVFAGGDVVTGPFLVVTAVRDGLKAAMGIDLYLRNK